ncbi:uncharacterized protein EI90DRAFT_902377 [Cantharellus anzutake]|uniref:uncharacterized protein n=1 Tax=Cantharellus anzutake TaxID=1750568 RepID=UPI001903B76E|nr:uncharacterized protein EI90DRAFT_902377 [Cantharellus anzutake]KAF8331927.1 hypothetical protein EI90DRAFT_902377 [Cantharellus anzutake]
MHSFRGFVPSSRVTQDWGKHTTGTHNHCLVFVPHWQLVSIRPEFIRGNAKAVLSEGIIDGHAMATKMEIQLVSTLSIVTVSSMLAGTNLWLPKEAVKLLGSLGFVVESDATRRTDSSLRFWSGRSSARTCAPWESPSPHSCGPRPRKRTGHFHLHFRR